MISFSIFPICVIFINEIIALLHKWVHTSPREGDLIISNDLVCSSLSRCNLQPWLFMEFVFLCAQKPQNSILKWMRFKAKANTSSVLDKKEVILDRGGRRSGKRDVHSMRSDQSPTLTRIHIYFSFSLFQVTSYYLIVLWRLLNLNLELPRV